MTIYTFKANPSTQLADWDDPSSWVGGVVPDSLDADVVFPTVTTVSTGEPYVSYVTLSGEDIEVNSVNLANNYLEVYSTLTIVGDLSINQGGGIVMQGGSLSLDTCESGGVGIEGSGQVTGSGLLTNETEIVGSGLTLTLAGLTNNGSLQAASGNLTVDVRDDGLTNLSGSTLTGGTYTAGYSGNTVANSNTLYLKVGSEITTDAANISLEDGGAIDVYDDAMQQYVPIETSLDLIASTGLLSLGQETYNFPSLTVDGEVTLANSTLDATDLAIDAGGQIDGYGTVDGDIVDNGTLIATNPNEDPSEELIIAGSLSGNSAVQIHAGLWEEGILRSGIVFSDSSNTAGTLEISGTLTDNVNFLGDLGTLIIDNPLNFGGGIATDGAGDTVQLQGISLTSVVSYSYSGNTSGGTLTINCGAVSYNVNFLGNFDKSDFTLTAGPQTLSNSPPSLLISNSGSPSITFTNFGSSEGRTQTILGDIDSADAGVPVSLYDGTTFLATVATATDGTWSATITLTATPGTHYVTARATDAAGNVGISDPIQYFLPPTLTIADTDELPDSAAQTIAGTIDKADAGQLVSIFDGTTLLVTATPNSLGAWSANVTLSANGPHVLTAQAGGGVSNAVDLAAGPSQTISFPDAADDAASLCDSGSNWDIVNGSGGLVYLTSAQAQVNGGGDTVNFSGGSDDAASLVGTGGDWDIVNGSSGLVALTNAYGEVTGGGDAIYFEGSSDNAAALYNTAGAWDAVNGSDGLVVLTNAYAEVIGGGDAIYFEGASGNATALYNTAGVWDVVNGSNGLVVLTNAYAEVIGGGDAIYFEGSSGNATALYNTAGAWDAVNGSGGLVVLTNAYAAVTGGGDAIYFEGGPGNATSLYDTGGNQDAVNGSDGLVVLDNAQASVAGAGDIIYLFGANTVTQNGDSDGYVLQPVIGQQTINGFAPTDSMQFSVTDFADWTALSGHISQSGANTVIALDAADTVTLTSVAATSLTASQFRFV